MTNPGTAAISCRCLRDCAPRLRGIRASSLASLTAQLRRERLPRSVVAADLSYGPTSAHQVATEFRAQVSPRPSRTAAGGAQPASTATASTTAHGDFIGRAIDAESRGNARILEPLRLADEVRGTVVRGPARTLLVIAPRFGHRWPTEDVLFLRVLANGLEGGPSVLVVVDADATRSGSAVPHDWVVEWSDAPPRAPYPSLRPLVSLVPGVIGPRLAEELRTAEAIPEPVVMPLHGEHLLVAPEVRRAPAVLDAPSYDRLAAACRSMPSLRAYAFRRGTAYFAEVGVLCDEASRLSEAGSPDIALDLADYAGACARSEFQRGVCLAVCQGIRIAHSCYRAAAAQEITVQAVPARLLGFLEEAKGWALTMTGNPAAAETHLAAARELSADVPAPDHLYLLNISALNKLRLGNHDAALALEEELAQRLAESPSPDTRIAYVNAVNLARLHRLGGRLDDAHRYYNRAFAITAGSRSESEAIYVNFCLARLAEERSRPQEAFTHWLRAALHLVTARVPEAIAARVAAAVLGEYPEAGLCELLAQTLGQRLIAAADTAGQPIPSPQITDPDKAPAFLRADRRPRHRDHGPMVGRGGPGWSVFQTARIPCCSPGGEQHARLRASLVGALLPDRKRDGIAGSVLIDDRDGRELAGDAAELVESCLRLGAESATFACAPVALDDRASLESALLVRVGPAVDRIVFAGSRALVAFTRQLGPRVYGGAAARVLAQAGAAPPVGALACLPSHRATMALLRELERARVLVLSMPSEKP